MFKSTKKVFLLLLVVLITLGLVLSGCGGKEEQVDEDVEESVSADEIDYPAGPITAICPWSAGSSSDIAFRGYMKYLAQELGVDINVQNVTGGDGEIAYAQTLTSEADGYTMVMINYDLLSNVVKGITDTTYNDFAVINMFTAQDVTLVTHTDYGWETFEDFKQAALDAKSEGKKLNIGVTGFWLHAAGMIAKEAGISDAVTMVPFDGASDQVADLLGKHLDAMASSTTVVLPHLETGTMRILGTMGAERDPDFPDVPTFTEMGYDAVIAGFRALAVHKDTDPAIVDILREAGKKAFDNPEFQEWADDAKIYQEYMDHEETVKYMEDLAPKVEETMKDLGLI